MTKKLEATHLMKLNSFGKFVRKTRSNPYIKFSAFLGNIEVIAIISVQRHLVGMYLKLKILVLTSNFRAILLFLFRLPSASYQAMTQSNKL